ncbi:hypothetical protein B0H21DRAFT_688455 [Amylocystis lapponica]|nr:hypothetical protein B0H21DRAFT_688455 [Amylocystis lapponica]
MSATTPAPPDWLQQQLATLLASPYIHFTQPPALPSGRRLGHGPVDLFSTRFNNLFTHDAAGTVAAQPADRARLKRALLALQRTWAPDAARFTPAADAEGRVEAAWTPRGAQGTVAVAASAGVREEGGARRIASLVLEGEPALFADREPGAGAGAE